MSKLYFRYGAMGSGKTIDLLKVAYNYKERNQKVIIYTAKIDDRYEVGKITTRIGFLEINIKEGFLWKIIAKSLKKWKKNSSL